MKEKRFRDGSKIVNHTGSGKINKNHAHYASDGTLLSVKEKGKYEYNRREQREKINKATGKTYPTRHGR